MRGRPDNVEVEESESEGEENKLHVSESVAQKRLAELHNQQNGRRAATAVQKGKAPEIPQKTRMQVNVAASVPAPLVRVASEPITVAYPYNLPAPQPPTTPRTTRRTMLTHELPESLRRNLLWERQVSRLRPLGNGMNRRSSAGTAANGASGSGSNANSSTTNVDPKVAEEEEKRRRVERNRSWTDTFHTSGW